MGDKGENNTKKLIKTEIATTSAVNLRERARLLDSILASSIEYSIIGKDLNANVIAWSEGARQLYGYEPEEILGKSAYILHDPKDVESGKIDRILEEVRRQGKWSGELNRVKKSGKHFITAVSMYLRRDEQGSPEGYTLISKDISVKRASEKQIYNHHHLFAELEEKHKRVLEANRLKSEFLKKLSYELRTPLNSIVGFGELIYSGKAGPVNKEQQEYLDDILLSAKHLLKIINDVLDISKIEVGHLEFYPENIDIANTIDQVVALLETFIREKKIYLNIDVNKEVSSAFLDPMRFKQIIYHYLSNAIKFTPEYGSITIRVKPETPHRLRLEVEDNGIGIQKKDMGNLFLEFTQLGSNGTLRHGAMGTGLGLALVRHIVEAQKGEVGVKSVFGKGSVFYAIFLRGHAGLTSSKKKKSTKLISNDH